MRARLGAAAACQTMTFMPTLIIDGRWYIGAWARPITKHPAAALRRSNLVERSMGLERRAARMALR
jgi:hypothetical protein